MKLIGKPTINPFLFYSGKIAGYICWISIFFLMKYHFGLYIFYTGILITIISLFNLGTSISLGVPDEKTKLMTEGIYKFSRNPMYLGFHLMTISAMVVTGNLIIIILGIYSIIIYHFIILGEEKHLEKLKGYQKYKKSVRRYL